MPSGQGDDQETRYIYGTTKGSVTSGLSQVATRHLLRAVVYPDSTNAETDHEGIDSDDSDVVSYAYNALGQVVRMKDQAGNVTETGYDHAGRESMQAPFRDSGVIFCIEFFLPIGDCVVCGPLPAGTTASGRGSGGRRAGRLRAATRGSGGSGCGDACRRRPRERRGG